MLSVALVLLLALVVQDQQSRPAPPVITVQLIDLVTILGAIVAHQLKTALQSLDCYQESNGRYLIRIGHAKLYGSKKRRTLFEHRFVIYRGYTYEFGGSYNTQTLDVADPEYKYYNGRHLNSNGIMTDGSSYCSYEDAVEFTNSWTEK